MCEQQTTGGAYYLTTHEPKPNKAPTLADLAQSRLNETIEIERALDWLLQKVIIERVG